MLKELKPTQMVKTACNKQGRNKMSRIIFNGEDRDISTLTKTEVFEAMFYKKLSRSMFIEWMDYREEAAQVAGYERCQCDNMTPDVQ